MSKSSLRILVRKGSVLIMVLLILSLVLFYFSFTIGYDYTKSYNDAIEVGSLNGYPLSHYEFGDYYQLYPNSSRFVAEQSMSPGDCITASYGTPASFKGTVYMVLWLSAEGPIVIPWMNDSILEYTNSTSMKYTFTGSINYANNTYHLEEISIVLDVAVQNPQNATISLMTTLHNYRTPQWMILGAAIAIGVASIVLSLRSIARRAKRPVDPAHVASLD